MTSCAKNLFLSAASGLLSPRINFVARTASSVTGTRMVEIPLSTQEQKRRITVAYELELFGCVCLGIHERAQRAV